MIFKSSKELLRQAIETLQRIEENENVTFTKPCNHKFRAWYKSKKTQCLWTRRCIKCRYKELSYKEHENCVV